MTTTSATDTRLRVVFVGWGALSRAAAGYLADAPVNILAVATRNAVAPDGLPLGAVHLTDPDDLASLGADVVAEAAGRESVGPWGRAALASGADLVVSSVSAFADPDVLAALRGVAESCGSRIQIQPGAVAGVQALNAARYLGIDRVTHHIVKPPLAWNGTQAEAMCELESLHEACVFFAGAADETASLFPSNANVAMTTALAGIGPKDTQIQLVADPYATMNRHELSASGDFGELRVTIDNRPLVGNPKTSAMAALSLARAIENRTSAIVI